MAPKAVRKKVVILGDAAVGKTSLVTRFVKNEFHEDYIATIGARVSEKTTYVDGLDGQIQVSLQIWDVFGQHGYTGVQSTSLRGAAGAILVFDGTRPETLTNLATYWLPLLYAENWLAPIFLVGNKADLPAFKADQKAISDILRIYDHASIEPSHSKQVPGGSDPGPGRSDHGLDYAITSARTGQGVEDVLSGLAETLVTRTIEDPLTPVLRAALDRSPATDDPQPATPVEFLDWMIVGFLGDQVDIEPQLARIRVEMVRARVNLVEPSHASLKSLIQGLLDLEIEQMEPEDALRFYNRRTGLLDRSFPDSWVGWRR